MAKARMLLVLLLLPAASLDLPAQEDLPGIQDAEETITDPLIQRLSEVIGTSVAASGGDVEGTVQDVVFDGEGRITHLVIEVAAVQTAEPARGGSERSQVGSEPNMPPGGFGEYPQAGRYLVASEQARFDSTGGTVLLELDARKLGQLQEVEGERLPEPLSASALASLLLDDEVIGEGEVVLGRVEDLMLDVRDMRVAYLALASGGFLGLGEAMYALPPEAVRGMGPDGVRVALDRRQLERMEPFDPTVWPTEREDYEEGQE